MNDFRTDDDVSGVLEAEAAGFRQTSARLRERPRIRNLEP
jgi:hypothetical protein